MHLHSAQNRLFPITHHLQNPAAPVVAAPTPSEVARQSTAVQPAQPASDAAAAPASAPAPVLPDPAPPTPAPEASASPSDPVVDFVRAGASPSGDQKTRGPRSRPAAARPAPRTPAAVRPSTPDGTPLASGHGRSPWVRLPGRRGIGPVSVVLVIGLELLVLGALVIRAVPSTPALVVGVLLAVLGVLLAVPYQGMSVGGWLLRRVRLAATPRVRRAPEGARATAPLACFPDVTIQQVRTPRDAVFGVARWSGTAVAALELGRHRDAGRVAGAHLVPLGAVRAGLRASGVELESVALVERSDGPETSRVLALRLRPLGVPGVIEARGGGERGILATMATAVALTRSRLRDAGIPAHPLDRDALLAELLAQTDPAPGAEGTAAWQGTWDGVVGPHLSHRVLVARGLAADADLALLRSGLRQRAVVEVGTGPDGPDAAPAARLLVRLLDESPSALAVGTAALQAVPGIDLAPVLDDTLDALAATTLLGSGRRRPDRAAAAAEGALETWLAAPEPDLDHVL